MPHDIDLLLTVAAGLGLAFVFGLAAARFHLPTILGYLLAGVVVGPFTPGFVADGGLASQLAEIGVILLMFGVGLHFSLDDLMEVRRIAIPGALVQIAAATGLGALVSVLWGWSWGSGIVFGLSLSVASTVVLLRALEDRGILDSMDGRVAVGWLIVEDLVTVVALVLLPAVASGMAGESGGSDGSAASIGAVLGLTALKLAAFLVIMLVGGRRVIPWLLRRVVHTGSRELFTLAVLAVALGLAVGAAMLFDVSFALGAFFAGVIVSESDFSHEAANNALPLQDAFAVLFFVSVGMLFDPAILIREPLAVITVVLIILIGKSVAAYGIVRAFGYSNHTALTISASLAQIGEFSFILAALGASLGLLAPESQSLVVAGALLSITLNPFVFRVVDPFTRWLDERQPKLAVASGAEGSAVGGGVTLSAAGNTSSGPTGTTSGAAASHGALSHGTVSHASNPSAGSATHSARPTPQGHVVIIGSGRVGFPVVRELHAQQIPYRVIEASGDIADRLAAAGYHVVHGDATTLSALREAGLQDARLVLVAAPDAWQARAVLARAHQLNPGVEVLVRTHSDEERQFLEEMGAARALYAERELAVSMSREAFLRFRPEADLEALTARILRGAPIPPMPEAAS